MINTLKEVWPLVKERQFQQQVKEVVISDGFLLKDALREDFKDGLAKSTLISFWMYNSTIGILTIIALIFFPTIGKIGFICWLIHTLCCFLGALPLSRLWLPDRVQVIVFGIADIGTHIFNIISRIFTFSIVIQVSLWFTKAMATLVQYIVLFPLYELARLAVGNRVVGAVKQQLVLYADIWEDHIEELLDKSPNSMNIDELYTLFHLYSNLPDVKAEYAALN
jgi:hypothetical protein